MGLSTWDLGSSAEAKGFQVMRIPTLSRTLGQIRQVQRTEGDRIAGILEVAFAERENERGREREREGMYIM